MISQPSQPPRDQFQLPVGPVLESTLEAEVTQRNNRRHMDAPFLDEVLLTALTDQDAPQSVDVTLSAEATSRVLRQEVAPKGPYHKVHAVAETIQMARYEYLEAQATAQQSGFQGVLGKIGLGRRHAIKARDANGARNTAMQSLHTVDMLIELERNRIANAGIMNDPHFEHNFWFHGVQYDQNGVEHMEWYYHVAPRQDAKLFDSPGRIRHAGAQAQTFRYLSTPDTLIKLANGTSQHISIEETEAFVRWVGHVDALVAEGVYHKANWSLDQPSDRVA